MHQKGPSPQELPILEQLFHFRHSLQTLRKETHGAITASDVNTKAVEFSMILARREEILRDETLTVFHNRTDDVIDTIWHDLFYCWNKLSCIDESIYPTYVTLVVISRTIDALRTSGAWTDAEITSLQLRVSEMDEQVTEPGRDFEFENSQAVLSSLLNRIHRNLDLMVQDAEFVVGPLKEVKDELETCWSDLRAFGFLSSFTLEDLAPISKRLHAIDSSRGPTGSFTGSISLKGQATVAGLLNECFNELTNRVADLDPVTTSSPLYPTFAALFEIREQLDHIASPSFFFFPEKMTSSLEPLMKRLSELETRRVNGSFVPEGEDFEHAVRLPGQGSMHKILHECREKISVLVEPMCLPVGEALVSTFEVLLKQRTALRRLRTWSYTGWNVKSELERVEEVLKTVEASREKGLFVGSVLEAGEMGAVPSGQVMVSVLLDECDSLVWQTLVALEE
ncbi:hypothetical protein HDU98_006237 [Podochytrium sp. JEL0797]|nr:hypothetical protein HDU98_006237 [Podochytrium sp. JEL0797]